MVSTDEHREGVLFLCSYAAVISKLDSWLDSWLDSVVVRLFQSIPAQWWLVLAGRFS